ncbi:hypothetical protein GGR54DRAFT_624380 [Hypoxylon sp. NC1633]|nr:hypothetical protein GGR54DRAFT_624380 [Hypoxylon sp. NC1633]
MYMSRTDDRRYMCTTFTYSFIPIIVINRYWHVSSSTFSPFLKNRINQFFITTIPTYTHSGKHTLLFHAIITMLNSMYWLGART